MHLLLEKYLQTIKSFIPSKSAVSSVGLDIEPESCKAVELVKSGDSFEILNWTVEPVDNADLESAIKKIFARLNLSSKAPYTAVSGKGALVRYIDMPRMPREDLKKSFDLEADRYFPFAHDQIYTDCYVLNPEAPEKQMSVLVAAAKKEIIHERMELLTRLGFISSFIGINSLAIANVFHTYGKRIATDTSAEGSQPTAWAVLDMEETGSSLLVLVDHLPRFNRDIFVGGKDLTKKISNLLGLSLGEAQKLRQEPHDRLADVLNICESVLMNLVSEVRFSFDYFTTEHNIPISKLFLSGGSSLLSGVLESFSKNLDIPVERWDPVQYFQLAPSISGVEIHKNAGQLGVALGLALYEYD